MRVLIDSNIILDVLQKREPFLLASSLVWKLCEVGKIDGFVSALTFTNIVYIMRKQLSPEKIREYFAKLQLIFTFVSIEPNDLQSASDLQWADYEDALQYVTAKKLQAIYIVTRNEKDFAMSNIPAVSPLEFLSILYPQYKRVNEKTNTKVLKEPKQDEDIFE